MRLSSDLERFVDAQSRIYSTALDEIRAGRKRTHWMWFIFPQLRDLGASEVSMFYGIDGVVEARDYLEHPLLGDRLLECTGAMINGSVSDVRQILGEVDSQKFRSCMTLFELVAPEEECFGHAIEQFFDGIRDEKSIRISAE